MSSVCSSNTVHHSPCIFPISTPTAIRNRPLQNFRIVAKSKLDAQTQAPITSTSFLSFLCPLLRLFSVTYSPYLTHLFISFSSTLTRLCLNFTYSIHSNLQLRCFDHIQIIFLYLLLFVICCFWQGGDPSQQRNFTLEQATSSLASLSRFPWGIKSIAESSLNKEFTSDLPISLQLFEFEACPFCRRVREAMTELDLPVEVYPCPKGSVRHRDAVRRIGGKEQFPFLIDQSSGISMYESGDIVKYLFERYGEGRNPSSGLMESTIFTGWMPMILRAGRGMTLWERSRPDPPPGKLELFSYENNPNARIVREALCELELPYILQNVGEGSQRMKLLLDVSGSKEVPYFIDHNTGFQSGDYKKILSYLFETYSTAVL